MQKPPPWTMELLVMTALCAVVIGVIMAIQNPPGDRTRFTLERSDTPQVAIQRQPLVADETPLGR